MDRVEEIVKEAERRLNAFYSSYGEWNGKGKRQRKKTNSKPLEEIDEEVSSKDKQDFFKSGPIAKPKIIRRIEPPKIDPPQPIENLESKIEPAPKKEPKEKDSVEYDLNIATDPSGSETSFIGLSSKDIIEKIESLTGERIKICVKSKKNVIRHAIIILKEKGFIVK